MLTFSGHGLVLCDVKLPSASLAYDAESLEFIECLADFLRSSLLAIQCSPSYKQFLEKFEY